MKSEEYKCPLCGKKFRKEEMKCHSGCLLIKKCNLLCCPNCGYSYKEQSSLVEFIQSLWRKVKK